CARDPFYGYPFDYW
nr:immunoglobulin heavy chain junction region [Mus musculus]